ncbi:hypothetical protein F2Q68_00010476 [Brassica cretica]|uniref:Uncharacterized protein n=1 Tax=Brassica cretica TaxID=69181 RepID=A0A8S9KQZ7_BRACR|nr:hypothetical protein F2Q68_00010476 [Brassica cretica]
MGEPRLNCSERPDLHAELVPCTDPWTRVLNSSRPQAGHRPPVPRWEMLQVLARRRFGSDPRDHSFL